MKIHRPARELLSEVADVLHAGARHACGCRQGLLQRHTSPLECVAETLREGRHYGFVSIALVVRDDVVTQASCGMQGSGEAELRFPIAISTRVFGALEVESEKAFSWEDRVLLQRVAAQLAHYLTGDGRYILRHAREAMAAPRARARASRG